MTLRLWLISGALGAFALLSAAWWLEHKEAARQRLRADSAVLQSKVDTGNAAIADRVAVERVTIITRTEETASAVEAIPSDDIPADVRTDWCGGLRYSTCGRPNPDRPGELPATVPGAEP